jgi:hypothetical protein
MPDLNSPIGNHSAIEVMAPSPYITGVIKNWRQEEFDSIEHKSEVAQYSHQHNILKRGMSNIA